ncbi:hypothetical protein T4B_5053 [Trichinella pseudospiralis]|uniref:Uncharacterized protein n=1 Tax=Trichinella pseudospiralis TaxID=6337 RepID=A0A0V1G8B1_TRIPS|nr:hypothetical protein T4B_5053 [Trichinella pseudospiralis]
MDNTCVSVNCINSKSFIVFSESYAELKYILNVYTVFGKIKNRTVFFV